MDRLRNPAHLIGLAIALLASAIKGDLIPPGAVKYTVYAMGALGLVGTYLFDGMFTGPGPTPPPPPAILVALLILLTPAIAYSLPAGPPIADPSPPVIVLPVEVPPVVAPAPPSPLLHELQALDAARAALAKSLGLPATFQVPPSFMESPGGKALTILLAAVGAGVTVVEAWASVRAATMPAVGAMP